MKPITKTLLLILGVGSGAAVYFWPRSTAEVTPEPAEVSEEPDTGRLMEALIEQVRTEPETVEQMATPGAEAPARVAAGSQTPPGGFVREAAPDLNPAQLSPALGRTYNNYSTLRTEAYRNPDSAMNRGVVADLEAARKERTSNQSLR